MANFITNLLAKAGPMGQMVNQASEIAKTMQSPNPMGALIGQADPRMGEVMDYINKNGGNPEKVFYMLAKEKGVDPNEVLSTVRSMLTK